MMCGRVSLLRVGSMIKKERVKLEVDTAVSLRKMTRESNKVPLDPPCLADVLDRP